MTSLRLGWRLQRFELGYVLAIGFVAGALAIVEASRLSGLTPGTLCLTTWISQGATLGPGCLDPNPFFTELFGNAGKLTGLLLALPWLIGIVPGASLISGEIEQRTAQLAWNLLPQRRTWLVERTIPIVLTVFVAATFASVAGLILANERYPWLDASNSFQDYGVWGPVLVARTLACTALGLLVGAIIGRPLPAFLVSVALSIAVLVPIAAGRPFGQPLSIVQGHDPLRADLVVSTGFLDSTGALLTEAQAKARAPLGLTGDDLTVWLDANFKRVDLGVPQEEAWTVELRESAILLVVALVACVGTVVVVDRRRPY